LDPHIFADQDPGSQNLADPDPKHCPPGSSTFLFPPENGNFSPKAGEGEPF